MFVNGHVYVIHCSFIKPPKDKICLCICSKAQYFFFINSKKYSWLPGQVLLNPADCTRALSHESYVDLSNLKTFSPNDLATAESRGPIHSDALQRIIAELEIGVDTLSGYHTNIIKQNLT